MKAALASLSIVGFVAGCLNVTEPPTVSGSQGAAGGSTADNADMGSSAPCPASTLDAGTFDFDVMPDIGLGVGTTNPSTPPDGGTAFSGDATVSPAAPVAPSSPCL